MAINLATNTCNNRCNRMQIGMAKDITKGPKRGKTQDLEQRFSSMLFLSARESCAAVLNFRMSYMARERCNTHIGSSAACACEEG